MFFLPNCKCCSDILCATFNPCLYWISVVDLGNNPTEIASCLNCSGSKTTTPTGLYGCSAGPLSSSIYISYADWPKSLYVLVTLSIDCGGVFQFIQARLGFRCESGSSRMTWHARLDQTQTTAAGSETFLGRIGVTSGAWEVWNAGSSIIGTFALSESGVGFAGQTLPWLVTQNPIFPFEITPVSFSVYAKESCNPLP